MYLTLIVFHHIDVLDTMATVSWVQNTLRIMVRFNSFVGGTCKLSYWNDTWAR